MKNLKTILYTAICIAFIGIQNATAQTEGGQQHITIQVFEPIIGAVPEMLVIDNNGEITSTELNKVNLRKYKETFGENALIIHKEINKWTKNGYEILTYDKEPPSGGDYFITNIILVKD